MGSNNNLPAATLMLKEGVGKCLSTTVRPNKANQRELESKVLIGSGWGCEGYKATKFRHQPFQ